MKGTFLFFNLALKILGLYSLEPESYSLFEHEHEQKGQHDRRKISQELRMLFVSSVTLYRRLTFIVRPP